MDKYKEIEDLIAFKDCVCAKEILNSSSMKTDIYENEVVKIDQVIIGELREHYHYIELYFYELCFISKVDCYGYFLIETCVFSLLIVLTRIY